jgi:hypothetical protein
LTANERFAGIAFRTEVTGAPVLQNRWAGSIAALCLLPRRRSHHLRREVVALGKNLTQAPLLYYRSGYQKLEVENIQT